MYTHTQLFTGEDVETGMADEVIEFGISKRWFFLRMEEKGVLEKPILKSDFYYIPMETDSVVIPPEAARRKKVFEENFSVKQWVIGHEIKVSPEEDESEPEPEVKPQRETKEIDIPWEGIATVGMTLVLGAGIAIAYGIMFALSALDPQLVAVLDDEDETWIIVCAWLDE